MPIISTRVTVGTTPTLLTDPRNGSTTGPITASLLNLGPEDVDLGGAGVSVGTGFLLRVGGTFDVDLIAGDLLYGIGAAGTSSVCVLRLMQ